MSESDNNSDNDMQDEKTYINNHNDKKSSSSRNKRKRSDPQLSVDINKSNIVKHINNNNRNNNNTNNTDSDDNNNNHNNSPFPSPIPFSPVIANFHRGVSETDSLNSIDSEESSDNNNNNTNNSNNSTNSNNSENHRNSIGSEATAPNASRQRVAEILARDNEPNKVYRVYCDGIFDLFHFGHARALQQAKQLFPNTYLIVGVCSDEDTHKLKGKTVLTELERSESVKHCKWVDEVIVACPWIITQEFLDKYSIDYVSHDAIPYSDTSGGSLDASDCYYLVKSLGKFVPTERTEGISTSDIINRIVSGYDEYIKRNLLRGYTRKELNVSFLKEKRIKLNAKMENFTKKLKDSTEKVDHEIDEIVDNLAASAGKFVDNSTKYVDEFLGLFGGVSSYFIQQKNRLKRIAQKAPM